MRAKDDGKRFPSLGCGRIIHQEARNLQRLPVAFQICLISAEQHDSYYFILNFLAEQNAERPRARFQFFGRIIRK